MTDNKDALSALEILWLDEAGYEVKKAALHTLRTFITASPSAGVDVSKVREVLGKAIYAYNFAPNKEYSCKKCQGGGREIDDTPCSNPNETAMCWECSGKGYKIIHATQNEKLDAAMAVLSPALQSLPDAQGWQSIESAPMDGTRILLGDCNLDDEGNFNGVSCEGRWIDRLDDGMDYMGHDAGWQDSEVQYYFPGRSFGSISSRRETRQPTHWQPLPQPPSKEKT